MHAVAVRVYLVERVTRGIQAELLFSEYITHFLTNFDESNVRVNFHLLGIIHFLCHNHLKSFFTPQKFTSLIKCVKNICFIMDLLEI